MIGARRLPHDVVYLDGPKTLLFGAGGDAGCYRVFHRRGVLFCDVRKPSFLLKIV